MRPLRNLTLHEQGETERQMAAEAGFLLESEPEGLLVASREAGLATARARLGELLAACWAEQSAALIGGHTALWICAVFDQRRAGKLPDLFYFDIRRVRDDAGRFVFVPEHLTYLELSSAPIPA